MSKVGDKGKIPSVGHLFFVVFNPTIPLSDAGILTEPPVSVPMVKAARPEATATAEPLLDPPGILCVFSSHGFLGVPLYLLSPVAPKANSTVCVLPKIIQPRDFNLLTKLPSGPVISSLFICDPLVVGISLTEQISLIATGIPIKGPKSTPEENSLSIPSAQVSPWFSSTYI